MHSPKNFLLTYFIYFSNKYTYCINSQLIGVPFLRFFFARLPIKFRIIFYTSIYIGEQSTSSPS